MVVNKNNLIYFRAPTEFWCSPPVSDSNISIPDWINLSSPPMLGNAEARNSCYVYNLNWSDEFKKHNGNLSSISIANTTEVVKCTNFQHNQTFWKHTTIQVRNWNFHFHLK